jgi:hypothetical protein
MALKPEDRLTVKAAGSLFFNFDLLKESLSNSKLFSSEKHPWILGSSLRASCDLISNVRIIYFATVY